MATFPAELKDADMTPGHKKDDKSDKCNYRPISILSTTSKIFEKLMYTDIDEYMSKFMSTYLCGFRKGYSAQNCLLIMLEKMKRSLDNRQNAAALLTDLSKAFDCISHELLIAKLDAYGFSELSLKYIYSYLSERRQRTNVNGSYSSWLSPDTGVPQGSILGPLLFNIYINDIFLFLDEDNLANYADDTTPYATGNCLECVLKKLEDDANIIATWFKDNGLKINEDKCHLLVPKHGKDVYITVNGEKIKGEVSAKLLGVTMNNKLDFTEHVSGLCKKASQKLHALYRISPYINKDRKRNIMQAFISSQFNYCPLIWMFHNRSTNNRINGIQERALRLIENDYESPFEKLLEKTNSFTIHDKNLKMLAIEIYKTQNNLNPMFMKNLFPLNTNNHNLRVKNTLKSVNIGHVKYGSETLSYRAPQIWSMLPECLKTAKTLNEFKAGIKKWKPEGCACRICKTYIQRFGFI